MDFALAIGQPADTVQVLSIAPKDGQLAVSVRMDRPKTRRRQTTWDNGPVDEELVFSPPGVFPHMDHYLDKPNNWPPPSDSSRREAHGWRRRDTESIDDWAAATKGKLEKALQ